MTLGSYHTSLLASALPVGAHSTWYCWARRPSRTRPEMCGHALRSAVPRAGCPRLAEAVGAFAQHVYLHLPWFPSPAHLPVTFVAGRPSPAPGLGSPANNAMLHPLTALFSFVAQLCPNGAHPGIFSHYVDMPPPLLPPTLGPMTYLTERLSCVPTAAVRGSHARSLLPVRALRLNALTSTP